MVEANYKQDDYHLASWYFWPRRVYLQILTPSDSAGSLKSIVVIKSVYKYLDS